MNRLSRVVLSVFVAGGIALVGSIDTAEAQQRPAPRPQPARATVFNRAQPRSVLPPRLRPNQVKLSERDLSRLNQTAARFDREIRSKFTPVVDLHMTEASLSSGVRFKKVSNPRTGIKGPTVFEVTGIDNAGGVLNMVMSGGASGHVMQQKYGNRSLDVVEGYGQKDTVYLTHKGPGATKTTEVVKVQSRGLVTQEGFTMKLAKGAHNFFYFRGGPNERSGGEGSEPELRHVKLIVK